MTTLITIAALILVTCIAAAGLIAAAQNHEDTQRATGGMDLGDDLRV